eukprot:s164_g3.t1
MPLTFKVQVLTLSVENGAHASAVGHGTVQRILNGATAKIRELRESSSKVLEARRDAMIDDGCKSFGHRVQKRDGTKGLRPSYRLAWFLNQANVCNAKERAPNFHSSAGSSLGALQFPLVDLEGRLAMPQAEQVTERGARERGELAHGSAQTPQGENGSSVDRALPERQASGQGGNSRGPCLRNEGVSGQGRLSSGKALELGLKALRQIRL